MTSAMRLFPQEESKMPQEVITKIENLMAQLSELRGHL